MTTTVIPFAQLEIRDEVRPLILKGNAIRALRLDA